MYTFWNNCPVNSSKQHLLCVSSPNHAGSHSVVPVNYVDVTFCPLLWHLLQDIKQTGIVQTREIEREDRYSLHTNIHMTHSRVWQRDRCIHTHRVRTQVCLISGNDKCDIYPSMHLSVTSALELGNSSPRFSPGYLQHTALECACGDWLGPERPPRGGFFPFCLNRSTSVSRS